MSFPDDYCYAFRTYLVAYYSITQSSKKIFEITVKIFNARNRNKFSLGIIVFKINLICLSLIKSFIMYFVSLCVKLKGTFSNVLQNYWGKNIFGIIILCFIILIVIIVETRYCVSALVVPPVIENNFVFPSHFLFAINVKDIA